MIRIAVLSIFSVVAPLTALSATQAIYINNGPVNAPPDIPPTIDATAFVNRAPFHVDGIFFTGLPYQTANTRYFTNASSGVISGNPGFRFDYSSGNTRSPMYNWVNQGSISGDTFLLVSADNITSTGPLNASDLGLVRLSGGNVNLSRNGVRAAVGFTNSFFFSTATDTNYSDPFGVTDFYWGVGTNNVLTGNGAATPVPGTFTLPFPSAPTHRVFFAGSTLPSFGFVSLFDGNAGAFVYTNTVSPTSQVVQIVFVPTNNIFDTNISTRVFFTPDADDGATAVVEFKYPEFDVVNQEYTTNYFYFLDSTAFATNLALANNIFANTRRPNKYDIIRYSSPGLVNNFLEVQTNATYAPDLLYKPTYASNSVGLVYAAYGAQIDAISVLNGSGQNVAASTDPTNYPGRVEITGDRVNLDLARIGAQSTVIIKANDLASNKVAKISAPFENLDLRTTQPEMVITNFAPNTVQRLSGPLYAYSATWRNFDRATTNTIFFHVLLLDSSNLRSTLPITINELKLHAPRLVIGDPLAAGKTMLLDTRNLEITGGLSLPFNANWGNTNVVEVYTLTNRGFISVGGTELIGTDRANPYDYYVNFGTNSASAHDIRTRNFFNQGLVIANAGVFALDATVASIAGPLSTNFPFVLGTNVLGFLTFQQITNVNHPTIQANGNIQITADQVTFSNAVLQTGPSGSLSLSPGSSLTDGGTNAISTWNVSGGFNLYTIPTTSSLLGTYVTSTTARNSESFHTWSARDRGATSVGYTNNSALGKLTLDAGEFSLVHFTAAPGFNGRALYVDYLELLNYATNVNTQLAIDSSITIYFANANINPEKIDGAAGGRLRWVKGFAGPLSSKSYTYPDGEVYTFNSALVGDLSTLDCDRDGILNGTDLTPVYTKSSVGLEILSGKDDPTQVMIRWNAFPGVANTVQSCSSFVSPQWVTVRSVVPPGPYTAPYTVTDSTAGGQRIYRVIVSVPEE